MGLRLARVPFDAMQDPACLHRAERLVGKKSERAGLQACRLAGCAAFLDGLTGQALFTLDRPHDHLASVSGRIQCHWLFAIVPAEKKIIIIIIIIIILQHSMGGLTYYLVIGEPYG